METLLHVDNHLPKASHGELQERIYESMKELAADIDIYVRERAFSRFARETQALNKVVGLADLIAWQNSKSYFQELAPTTVKKLLTGNGRAEKADVAASLERYLGMQDYRTDDESDAAAVGIAWLIQEKLLAEI